MTRRTLLRMAVVPLVAASFVLGLRADHEVRVALTPGEVFMEFVGQVVNFPTTPATSHQFGYLTYVRGLDRTFTGSPETEQTAMFTFYNVTTTTGVLNHGPLRVIVRTGTTTIYAKTWPSSFSDPGSFRDGTPVQVSTLRHTVLLNTTTNAFTTIFENHVTEVTPFLLNGALVRLGQPRETFRMTVVGQVPSPTPPAGWIAGYAEGTTER